MFSRIGPLLLVYGRNSYKKSDSLSQFGIYRSLISTSVQAVSYAMYYFNFSCISVYSLFIWVLISIYQGGVIIFWALLLFEEDLLHIVAISITLLILMELAIVTMTIRTWHPMCPGPPLCV